MKVRLRDYQQELVSKIHEALKTKKYILVQAGVGSGKTVVFSHLAKEYSSIGLKVCILSNRTELLMQSGGSLERIGVKCEYVSPRHKNIPEGLVVSSMAQTLRRRAEDGEWLEWMKSVDVYIIDEAHMDDASFIFDKIRHDAKVIGFSATPKRSGKQRQLGLDYEEIVSAISIKELIAKDFLCPARYFTLDAPDLTGVKYNPATGDYQEKSMGNIFDSPKRYEGLLENWQRICPDSKTIVFCASQVHAIKTALEFEKAGVEVRYIISGIPKDDEDYHFMEETSRLTGKRKELIQAFKDNKFKVLVNAQILTAGFDCPDVETIVMNKATLSPATYIQAIGRGSRPAPGKDHFKVLDFGDNVHRLGLYENDRTWSLWHETKEGGGVPMTKECGCNGKDRNGNEGCGRLIPITMGVCPFCSYSFMTPEELRKVELREIVDGKFEFKDMTPKQMAAYCELQGYSKNYLFRQLYYGAEDRRQFVQGMRELGYDWKFSYFTYDRLSK